MQLKAIVDSSGDPMPLTDLGQVRNMELPAGWCCGRQEEERYSLREFNPPGGNPLARLTFYYRGVELDKESGRRFQEILNEPPHLLSAGEIRRVGQVLRQQADPRSFCVQAVWTASLNGRTILLTSGHWLLYDQSAYALYIDACGTGRTVQEIYFTAPPVEYCRHIADVLKALYSIQWK